jgi:cytochrome c oxidase assembly protein Cox11
MGRMMIAPSASALKRRRVGSLATLAGLCAVVAVMLTLVSYSVTLYRLFCQATGAGGTTQRVAAATAPVSGRIVTVSFNTDTAPGLPWRFRPLQRQVQVHLGQESLALFEAENLSDQTLVGHATFNVTPDKAGLYFKKIQCFCFTEERLGPHQRVEMPVSFFVDPALAADRGTQDVREITLSYTFFLSRDPAKAQDLSRFGAAGQGSEAGRENSR